MKNIFIIPTDQPSRLQLNVNTGKLILFDNIQSEKESVHLSNQNIYITSSEEIKEGVNQWYLDKFLNKPMNSGGAQYGEKQNIITLTTDPELIEDGVQSIDDEFLEWFVKNPTCEFVEVELECFYQGKCVKERCLTYCCDEKQYKIIIPQEESKQEKE